MTNRAACFACRQRACSAVPVSVRSCRCGYTASYCRADGGLVRVRVEIAEHQRDCVVALRVGRMEKLIRARPATVYVVTPDPDKGA